MSFLGFWGAALGKMAAGGITNRQLVNKWEKMSLRNKKNAAIHFIKCCHVILRNSVVTFQARDDAITCVTLATVQ